MFSFNANNPSQRTPCLLVLDASGSMDTAVAGRTRMALLNDGIAAFHASLQEDELALSRVQIAAVNAGGPWPAPNLFLDWTDAVDFHPFPMSAAGTTPLGEAMLVALEAVEQHKATLRELGISYMRPWIFVLTDGAPTDPPEVWQRACQAAREHESASKVQIFPIGIGGADLAKLSELSATPAKTMDAVHFRELFVWLSASLGTIARSVPGDRVNLPSTDPWSSVRL